MVSNNSIIGLQPNGLYIILSQPKDKATIGLRDGSDVPSSADRFCWGLYWCKNEGVGISCRYHKKNGDWVFEQHPFPNDGRPDQVSIEKNDRVVLALQIENMAEDMANVMPDRLGPGKFQHSQPYRARMSETSRLSQDGLSEEEDETNRSRNWLGHALHELNDTGFISLKDTVTAGQVESEALAKAKANIQKDPPFHTVEISQNVKLDVDKPASSL